MPRRPRKRFPAYDQPTIRRALQQDPNVTQELLTAAMSPRGAVIRGTAAEALATATPARGIFYIHAYRQSSEREFGAHARLLQRSLVHPLVAGAQLLLHCNNPSVPTRALLRYLALYGAHPLRMLIHSSVNRGYRCGELYSLAASARVWQAHPWLIQLQPDVHLTPTAVEHLARLLPRDEETREPTFIFDPFPVPRGKPPQFNMDYFVLRMHRPETRSSPGAAARTNWFANASALCMRTTLIPEAVLAKVVAAFNASVLLLGGRAPLTPWNIHNVGRYGVWHEHNLTAVEWYLRTHTGFHVEKGWKRRHDWHPGDRTRDGSLF